MKKTFQNFFVCVIACFAFIAGLFFWHILQVKSQVSTADLPIEQSSSSNIQRKNSGEVLLSETENGYNPIPNPDGSLIAYVRTGWGRRGGSGGFGRSNLVSEVMIMDTNGNLQNETPLADEFIYGWTSDGKSLITFRDRNYSVTAPNGEISMKGKLPESSDNYDISERIAYLLKTNSILWLQKDYKNIKREKRPNSSWYITKDYLQSAVKSSGNESIKYDAELDVDSIMILSPDERYLAVAETNSNGGGSDLRIYDRQKSIWTDLGKIIIHPADDWDYIKPMWNPWFADSTKLVFATDSGITISTPDGKSKQIISKPNHSNGLAVPSPDGKFIAYATFEPTQMKGRSDLKFWGNSTIWIMPAVVDSKAVSVTKKNQDTSVSLRWINDNELVFDRIADEQFYEKARLWKVDISEYK